MKRQLLAAALLALAAQAQAETSLSTLWPSLWRNVDQRAEAMLQQGHASDAAKLYTDPRRKAYAQIQAGDYGAAASGLKTLNDAEAHYNRGNALAQAGDLQGALEAYDAALKQNPTHQDARHNRDLVAKAMQKQKEAQKNKPQEGKSQDKPQNKKDSNQSGQNGQRSRKPDGQQGDQQGKPGDKPDGAQDAKPDNNAGGKPSDKSGDKPGGKQGTQQASNSNDKPGDKGRSAAVSQNQPGASSKPDATQPQAANDAEQARRDVNATLQSSVKDVTGDVGNAQGNTTPLTEKQIAQEQWLHSIPDDPGGLLRRKFLIEHLMRQRDAKP